MLRQHFVLFGAVSLFFTSARPGVCAEQGAASGGKGVQITKLDDRLRVEINGQLFTEYFFKDVPRPYCYPLIGPGGAHMTRNWPMKNVPDLEPDRPEHKHHRSLWFAQSRFVRMEGTVNGTFAVAALPPGQYFVAAIEGSATVLLEDRLDDPNFLESLVPAAERVSLAAGQRTTVVLKTR